MLNKAKIIFLAFLAMSIFLTSCEDDTEDPVLPGAPTNLQATSIDSTTIAIKWELSADHGTEGFVGYVLNVIDETGASFVTDREILDYAFDDVENIDGLTHGKKYTISVASVNNDGTSDAISIEWSPAYRLNETLNNVTVRVYGAQSQNGSGLKVYTDWDGLDGHGPEVLSVARKAEWNLAFDDTGGKIRFGSANEVSIGQSSDNPLYPAKLSNRYYNSTDLNSVFDSKALNKDATFNEDIITLTDEKYASLDGLVLVFAVPTDQENIYNYGKILIKKDTSDDNYVFNEGNDQYIECVISYQRKEDVPYAKLGF